MVGNKGIRLLALLVVGATAVVSSTAAPGRAAAQPNPGNINVSVQLVPVAATGPDFVAPDPGSAISLPAAYNTNIWAIVWKCSYSGWAKINTYWSCTLRTTPADGNLLFDRREGTFASGSSNLGPWYWNGPPYDVCVFAHAHYTQYPAQSDDDHRCWTL